MFDIGFWELTLIAVVALLVVGPERLPGLARNVGRWVGRIRRYISAVRDDIEREIRADELRELMEKSKRSNPLADLGDETTDALGTARKELESAERESGDKAGAEKGAGPEPAAGAAAVGEAFQTRRGDTDGTRTEGGAQAPSSPDSDDDSVVTDSGAGGEDHERRSG